MRFKVWFIAALAAFVAAAGMGAGAQSVVLVPGTIAGTVSVAGLAINRLMIVASPAAGGASSTLFLTPDAASAEYSLTVNVPQSGTARFSARVEIATDQTRDYMRMPGGEVTVSASAPGQLDFPIVPGFVDPVINVSGGTLARAVLFIDDASFTTESGTSATAEQGFLFAAIPGTALRLGGSLILTDGRQLPVPLQTLSVAAGQTVSPVITLIAPPPPNRIEGAINVTGPFVPESLLLRTAGRALRSLTQAPVGSSYLFDAVDSGSYTLSGQMEFLNSRKRLVLPDGVFAPSPQVTPNGATTVDLDIDEAFLTSTLSLTGAATLRPLVSNATTGISGTTGATRNGAASDEQFDRVRRTFNVIATPGEWRHDRVGVSFSRSAPSLFASFDLADLQPEIVTLTAGQTTRHDVSVALGEITVSITGSDGAVFSNPRLFSSSCSLVENDQVRWTFFVTALSFVQNVASAQLTFAAPAGTCTISPAVTVGGSDVTLDPITVTIVPGASQVIDVGGPVLSVGLPSVETIVNTPSVPVAGRVTDDVGVASVAVNGAPVFLSPTNNPADPREMAFSTTVTNLQRGPNTITTVATDTADPGRTAVDTRTVYFDTAAPSLIFTPADLAQTNAATIAVSGVADDDAGIQAITVNGNAVPFTTTGNAAKPREVSFTASVPAAVGQNTIEVVVTDISNRTTRQTHRVTRTQQVATALSVGAVSITYGEPASTTAVLTANGIGVAGKTIAIRIGLTTVNAVTDASGRATVTNLPQGLAAGTYNAVRATFAGDSTYTASVAAALLSIRPAPLTITAADAVKTQGAPNPAFTASYAGFVGADTPAVLGGALVFTTPATTASPVGTYPIAPSGLTSPNYTIRYVSGTLTVSYGVCALYDTGKASKAGSTVPIKVQLCDVNGANLSSPAIAVSARELRKLSSDASADVVDAGNANPDADFRYDAGLAGYIYHLKTTGLTSGTWQLIFAAAGDPIPHATTFQIR